MTRLQDARAEYTRTVGRRVRRALEFALRPHLLSRRVTHVHGPRHVEYGPQELLVQTAVRNGALYIQAFMEHYRELGVAHHVFLDNGSTDDTIDRLCAYTNVTVLRSHVPYAKYENTMKRYLAERFSPGRWNLCADIDELFDYPSSDRLALTAFIEYLNARRFTAVVAQMLDMYSDGPLVAVTSTAEDRLKDKYPYFDLSAIERRPYEWSAPSRPAIQMHWGGVRRSIFGTNNGLTKAALVRMDGSVRPFVEWHQATGAVIADLTCVLRHYPFVSAFRDKVLDAVRTGRYGTTTTGEYIAYARALRDNPTLSLMGPETRRFSAVDDLVTAGFLVVSDEYRRWVSERGLPASA